MKVDEVRDKLTSLIVADPPQNASDYIDLAALMMGYSTWAAGGAGLASGSSNIADSDHLLDAQAVGVGFLWTLIPVLNDNEDETILAAFCQGFSNLLIRKLQENHSVEIANVVGSLIAMTCDMAANNLLARHNDKQLTDEQVDHVSRNLAIAFTEAMARENKRLDPQTGMNN